MNLAHMLVSTARNHGAARAISLGNQPVCNYAQLATTAAAFAGHLTARGLQPGHRVVLAMKNNPNYFAYLYGCWWGGFVAVPLNAGLHNREIAAILDGLDARYVVADEQIATHIGATAPTLIHGSDAARKALREDGTPLVERDSDDPAWIFFTSGTTGRPKGAVLTHGNLLAMSIAYLADVDSLSPDDSLIHLAATSHASGLFGLSFIMRGAEHVMLPSGKYDPDEVRACLSSRSSVSFFAPTTLLARMRRDGIGECRDAIRTIMTGAGPVLADDIRQTLDAFGPRLWNGYGQGETPCTITAMGKAEIAAALADGDEARLTSVGRSRSGVAIRIARADGSEAKPDEAGEVCVRGPTVMAGYLDAPEATAQTLRSGWLHTGDIGRLDRQGNLHLLDRLKDVIISGGMNVYAREVEEVLQAHPEVAEVAVIGLPDAEWGEAVCAFLVATDEARSDDLTQRLNTFCLERMARFKRPKHYEIVSELPRNAVGKVLKSDLRASKHGHS